MSRKKERVGHGLLNSGTLGTVGRKPGPKKKSQKIHKHKKPLLEAKVPKYTDPHLVHKGTNTNNQ